MPAVAPLVTGLFLLISSPSLLPPGVSIPYSLFSSIIPQSALPAYKSALPGASRSSVVPRNESHLQKGENSPKIISCKWDHLFLLSFSKNETCSPRGYHLSQSAFNNPKSQIPLFVPHSFFSNNETCTRQGNLSPSGDIVSSACARKSVKPEKGSGRAGGRKAD